MSCVGLVDEGRGPQGRGRAPRQDDAFRARRKVGIRGGSPVSQDAARSQAPLPTHGAHMGVPVASGRTRLELL